MLKSHKQTHDRHNIYTLMKAMFPPGYDRNDFVATHPLGKIMYGYPLLAPINQRVVNKLSNELYVIGAPRHTECSNLTKGR